MLIACLGITDTRFSSQSILWSSRESVSRMVIISAWSFLIRTPELIESGMREILSQAMKPACTVSKQRLALSDSNETLNPDLVFGERVLIGDVKYKIASTKWDRSDLYQIVTHTAGFQASAGVVIGFSSVNE